MKILSYKILNEATVNLFNKNASSLGGSIGRNLLKTTQISKRRGIEGASDTLKVMTRYIQLMFNFYDARGNAQLSNDINVAFGIYFTDGGNKAHLLPYYSNSIQDLVEQNLQYATLELFESGGTENIEDYFNSFTPKKFNFSLDIPNLNVFKQINNKYKFNILNQLESYSNANSQNYTIGFNASSGFRRLTLDRNVQSQGQGNASRYTYISFTVSAPTQAQQGQITQQQITTINNIFQRGQQNCTITFNGQSQNTTLGRFVTIIQYGNNSSIEIYTTNIINLRRNLPINLGQVYIKSNSLNIGNPTLCELNITNLR
jgi:hypothetical protein